MKRSGFKPRTEPMRPKAGVKRPFRTKPPRDVVEWAPRTALPKKNTKRQKARKEAGLVYGDYHFWISSLPCTLLGVKGHRCSSVVVGHHLRTVKNGGKDRGNEIPLCADLHTDTDLAVHIMGAQSFDAYWGIDSKQIATALELDYDDFGYSEAA